MRDPSQRTTSNITRGNNVHCPCLGQAIDQAALCDCVCLANTQRCRRLQQLMTSVFVYLFALFSDFIHLNQVVFAPEKFSKFKNLSSWTVSSNSLVLQIVLKMSCFVFPIFMNIKRVRECVVPSIDYPHQRISWMYSQPEQFWKAFLKF